MMEYTSTEALESWKNLCYKQEQTIDRLLRSIARLETSLEKSALRERALQEEIKLLWENQQAFLETIDSLSEKLANPPTHQ